MQNTKYRNTAMAVLLAICLGAATGLVLWLFLQAGAAGTALIWDFLPAICKGRWITVPVCALGGFLVGLVHRRSGNYPESLDTVLNKIRTEKHYDYRPMPAILVCALIPLICGSSVGPEAGLTGIITALCCWIGDNVNFAGASARLYSEIGEAVTLGHIFHMPLFGILAVEESSADERPNAVPKTFKLILYGLSAAACFFLITALNHLFHRSMEGFPAFTDLSVSMPDYLAACLYIPAGILLFLLFEYAEKLTQRAALFLPDFSREAVCGAVMALTGLAVPFVLFSGEEELAELMETFGSYAPWFLIGVCILKIVMTAFCLSFGMRGGHFFPLIFACSCMGFGLAMLLFQAPDSHVAFAAGIVTASTLGAQLKKPLAVSVLMLLCFPARMIFWIYLAAALSAQAAGIIKKKETVR